MSCFVPRKCGTPTALASRRGTVWFPGGSKMNFSSKRFIQLGFSVALLALTACGKDPVAPVAMLPQPIPQTQQQQPQYQQQNQYQYQNQQQYQGSNYGGYYGNSGGGNYGGNGGCRTGNCGGGYYGNNGYVSWTGPRGGGYVGW